MLIVNYTMALNKYRANIQLYRRLLSSLAITAGFSLNMGLPIKILSHYLINLTSLRLVM